MINVLSTKLLSESVISFPNLGIGEFTISSVAFTIFGREIQWYGVIMAFAVIAAFITFVSLGKRENVKFDTCVDLTLFAIPSAIIGGRLYFVIFKGGYHTFRDIIAVWDGGIAFYGVLFGGFIAVLIVMIVKKLNVFTMLDLILPSLIIGQSIGRWGNFTNGECFGDKVLWENWPFTMGLQNTLTLSAFGESSMVYVHPYFLYESIWTLLGFVLIVLLYKKKLYHGEVMLWYLSWYGLGRGILENIRMDSLMLGSTNIRVSSFVALIGAGICIPMIIAMRILYHCKKKTGKLDPDQKVDLSILLGIRKQKSSGADESKEASQDEPNIETYPLPGIEKSNETEEQDGNNT